MDTSTVVNIIALGISLGSLMVTGLLVTRQNRMMRHANELPIIVSLTQEYRSHEFQQMQNYVLKVVAKEHPAESGLGISNLPDDVREKVSIVISFYISLGTYVVFGLADDNLVLSLFGYRANQAWVVLEHLILKERNLRSEAVNQGNYATYFEDLVCRFRSWTFSIKVNKLDTISNDPVSG